MNEKKFNQSKYIQDYNKEHYARIDVRLPKTLIEEFKEKCKKDNISFNNCIKTLIEYYLNKD